MAVSMNSNSMRADFMISDAALPQRMAELLDDLEAQEGIFSQLLSNIGGAKVDAAVETVDTAAEAVTSAVEAVDSVRLDSSDAETAENDFLMLPDDPRELASMILKGEVDIKDVPADKLTPELMKLLMLMRKAGEFNKDDNGKDESDDETEPFDAVQAVATEQMFQQTLTNSVLMELYQIIEKQRAGKDKVAMVDGVFDMPETAQTLPSLATMNEEPAIGENIFTEMIDNLVETVKEEQEFVEELAETVPNVDMFVSSEKADVSEVIPQITEAAQTVEIPQPGTVSETTAEQTAAVQTAASQNEQTAQAVVQQNVPVEEFTVKTVKPEKSEIAENAVQQQEVVEPVAVKVVTRNENAQQLDQTAEQAPEMAVEQVPEKVIEQAPEKAVEQVREKAAEQIPEKVTEQAPEKPVERVSEKAVERVSEKTAEQMPDRTSERKQENAQTPVKTNVPERPRTAESRTERVKSATEEFEMLRNAKIRTNPADEVLGRTARPLNADSPIVFKREDGSEIEVRPSEIIEQTEKLVQKAVTENDETEYSMVLNPEDLGKITVKLTKAADGAVSVTIAAENARTQRIIEQHSDVMQSNLRSNGVNLESWQTVNERQQENAAQDYNGSSKNPYYRNDHRNAEDNSDGDMSFAELIASM